MQLVEIIEHLYFDNRPYPPALRPIGPCPVEIVNASGEVVGAEAWAIYWTALVSLTNGQHFVETLEDLMVLVESAQLQIDLGQISDDQICGQVSAVYKAYCAWCEQNIRSLHEANF